MARFENRLCFFNNASPNAYPQRTVCAFLRREHFRCPMANLHQIVKRRNWHLKEKKMSEADTIRLYDICLFKPVHDITVCYRGKPYLRWVARLRVRRRSTRGNYSHLWFLIQSSVPLEKLFENSTSGFGPNKSTIVFKEHWNYKI